MASSIIRGATYHRVHTAENYCELHIGGSYTMCAPDELRDAFHQHLGVCQHSAELIHALEEAEVKKREELKTCYHVMEGKTADSRDQWRYDEPARVITIHAKDDRVLAMLGAPKGESIPTSYEELKLRIDPMARPLVTRAEINTCPKRGKVCVFLGVLAGEERALTSMRYSGPANVPLPHELRTMAALYVDTSGLSDDYVLNEQHPTWCVLL